MILKQNCIFEPPNDHFPGPVFGFGLLLNHVKKVLNSKRTAPVEQFKSEFHALGCKVTKVALLKQPAQVEFVSNKHFKSTVEFA